MLVWIASYPRSGNTFFRLVAHTLHPQAVMIDTLRKTAAQGNMKPPIVPFRSTMPSDFEIADKTTLHFVKTHDLPPNDNHPAVYIVRDGRDVMVSYAWFSLVVHRGTKLEDVDQEMFRTAIRSVMLDRRSPYSVWSDHVVAWLRRPNTVVVRFENLIAQPAACVTQALERLAIDHQAVCADIPNFDELHARKPSLFRRGKVGSWRDEFPEDMLDIFWQEHGEGMRVAGYGPYSQPTLTADASNQS